MSQLTAGSAPPEVSGEAGGGAIQITLEGMQRVSAVKISPEVAGDIPLIEELVAAAMNDALAKARGGTQEAAMKLLQQLTGE